MTLMLIHHADRLHEGVTDRGADETEAVALQGPAHDIAVTRGARDFARPQRPPPQDLAVGESPYIGGESARPVGNLEKRLGIADESLDFQAIPDDSSVEQQAMELTRAIVGDFFRIEIVECSPVIFPLAQDGEPTESCLGALQTKHFEQASILADRNTPFLIVVRDVQRIRGAPSAAQPPIGVPDDPGWLAQRRFGHSSRINACPCDA